jgi:TolB-like protein/DNA-binding winged helix-turn-helix (wHTH) protein
MPSDILHGFWVGRWKVEPLKGAITGPDRRPHHLQPKVMDLLICLAKYADQPVTRDELLAEVWGEHAVSDEPLTRAIGELRRALQEDSGHPKYIETIPKRGYRLIAEVRLLKPVSHGKNVESVVQIPHTTGHRLRLIVMSFICVAVILLAYDKWWMPEPPAQSIAVLPFVAMSSGEDDGYFADGLTEELLNSLSQIGDLKVAGRASSFYYKDKTPSFREVGEALGVAHVLEGSVRRAGNRLRITAQLIAVDDGYHLWSATYDRSMDDIFAIQDDIANQVTGALKVTLLGEEAAALASYGTDNAEAQSLYLIAKARLRLGSHVLSQNVGLRTGHLRSARRLLEQAVDLDPDYAEAWAALGRAYLLVGTAVKDASGEALSQREAIKLSGGAVAKALALAPDLPEVRFADAQHLRAVSWYQFRETADRDRAITVFEVALEAAPNDVELLEAFADMRSLIDDKVGAIALYDRALALDPLSQVRLRRADAVFRTGRLAEARAEFMRIGELYPDAAWQLGIAAIEFNIGHLHHGILWSAGEPTYGWRFFAWATLGEKERALEGLSLIGSLGGEAAEIVEIGRYYFERDYSGLQAWFDSQTDISMATYLFWTAKSYLRDWPAVLANFETWSQEFPAWGENVRGTPADRERYLGGPVLLRDANLAAYLAYAYQENGAPDEAGPIWAWALELLDRSYQRTPQVAHEVQHIRSLIAAGRGETEAALEGFEALYAAGWRWLMCGNGFGLFYRGDLGWFEDSPLLDSIRDEPRFIAVVDQVKADNAAMLAELNGGLTLEDIMDEDLGDLGVFDAPIN